MSSLGTQVRFGDFVLLYGGQARKISQDQKELTYLKGLMTGSGFGQDNVFIESFNYNLTEEDEKQVYLIKNYKDCVFQIWPKLDFEAHKEYKKLTKSKASLDKQKVQEDELDDEDDLKKQQEQYYQDVVEKIKKVRARCETEKNNNYNQIDQARGKSVTYGQEIFLMHLNSSSFLNGQVSCSSSDQSAYRFELSVIFNRGMGFKIVPKYKLRQEGEPIQYRDNVLLLNTKLNCFVNFNTTTAISIDKQLPAFPKQYYKNIDVKRYEGRQRYECFISSITEATWQLLYFRSLPDKQTYDIMGHDLIYLKHTETQGLLTADYTYKTENNTAECYVRIYEGNEEEEKFSIFSIWEIEIPENSSRGEELVLATKVPNPKTGKVEAIPNNFILRHFLTGKVLTSQEVNLDGKKRIVPCLPQNDAPLKNSQIQFISTAGDEMELMENNICYLLAINDITLSVDMSVQYANDKIKKGQNKFDAPPNYAKFSDVPEDKIYIPLREQEYQLLRYGVMCEDRGTQEENAFQLQRVDPELSKDLYSVASQIQILQRYTNMTKTKQLEIKQNKDLIKCVQNALTFLIFFVAKSSLEKTSDNALIADGVPNRTRQRLIRDFGIVEIICDFLYYIFRFEITPLDKLDDVDDDMIKIFKLAYKCILSSIQDYAPNELFASQWLDLMIIQAKMTVGDKDIGAEETLTALIDNNRLILETKISEATIQQFMDMLYDEKEEKYVLMVYALCVCNNTPMIFNQAFVGDLLLTNKKFLNALVYPLTKENGNILIKAYKDQPPLKLKDFKEISERIDKGKNFYFFLSMLKLYSGLCLGRNYLALDILSDLYPLDLCYEIVSSTEYEAYLRRRMSKLVMHLWIDRAPYTRLILPDKVRIWNELGSTKEEIQTTFPSTNHGFQQLERFKQFILEELDRHSSIGYTRIFEKENNEILLEILNLMRMMLNFGFYQKAQELNLLINPLLKLLVSVYDVSDEEEESIIKPFLEQQKLRNENKNKLIRRNKQKNHILRLTARYDESDVNLVVHRIKKTICDSLVFIVKLRQSARVTYMLQKLKEESEIIEKTSTQKKQKTLKNIKIPSYEVGNHIDAFEYAKEPINWIKYLMENNIIEFNYSNKNEKIDVIQKIDHQSTLNYVLLDLSLYQNNELVNISFEFIISHFTQRDSLVKALQQIQLLEDPEQIQIFKNLKLVQGELSELVEKSEQWMWKTSQKTIKQENRCLELLNQIAGSLVTSNKQTQLFHDEPDGEIIPIDKKSKQEDETLKQVQLLNEGEQINAFVQDIIRNTKIYELAIFLLRFDVDQFTYRRQTGSQEFSSSKSVTHNIIKTCYLILARFLYLCPNNQEILYSYIESIFFKHLKYLPDCDLHLMLEPLLHDNKIMLKNQELIQLFLKQIAKTVNSLPYSSGLKPSYFRCLTELTKINGKIIKSNQTMIMNELTHRDYNEIVLLYDLKQFETEVKQLNNQIEQGSQNSILVPPKLDYFNGFVTLMAIICEDKNNATESKAQNYFPLEQFQKLLEIAGNCWYIRKNLMFFFYHVYLDTEREMTEELLSIKQSLILKLQDDMDNLSNSLFTNKINLLTHRGVISMKQVKEEYYFNALLLCVETIIKKRMIDDYVLRDNFHKSVFNSLIQVSSSLDQNDQRAKKIIRNMLSLLQSINACTDEQIKNSIQIKECIPNSQLILHAKRGQISLYSFVKESRLNAISQREEKLKKRMETIDKREDFQQQIREEMNDLILCILNIEENTLKEFKGACTIPFNEILIAMIEFTKQNARKDVKLTVLRLKIFRSIIEQKNNNCMKDIGDWENEDWKQFEMQIIRQQNLMVELGMVKMLYSIMMEQISSHELMQEAIHLSIALLLGGNVQAQNEFYNEMTNDQSNSFLIRIKERLDKGFETVKKSMTSFNKRLFDRLCNSSNNNIQIQDLLDIEDQEIEQDDVPLDFLEDENQETIEMDDQKSKQELIRLLRVLQLFCEGHNLTMQNYLRQQVIENQVLGRNNDFIYNSALEFAQVVKFVNVHCVDLGNQLLDFIIESIQGPCLANQQKLVGAKIIDSCKDLILKFQNPGDYEQYGFQSEEDKAEITALITKSNKLLVSLTEGSSDPYVFSQMAQTLDFDTLLERLKDQYFKFKERYQIEPEEKDVEYMIEKVADQFDETMMDTYQIFILLMQLKDHSTYLKDRLEELESPDCEEMELVETLNYFQKTTKSIEIQFNDQLIRVLFPVQPICRLLSENTRKRIMTEIPRESPNEKIEGLTAEAEGVFDEMEHMAYLNSRPFNFSQSRLNFLRDISTLISFAINFMMILTYHKQIDPNNALRYINVEQRFGLPVSDIMYWLGYAQLITSSLMLVFWVFIHSPLLLTIKWRNFLQQNQKEHQEELYTLDKYVDNEDIDPLDLPVSLTIKLLFLKGPSIPLFNRGLFKNFGNPYTLLMYFWKNFTFIFGDGNVKYFFFYICVSFIGKFVSELAYSLHLLDVIGRFVTLQNVIKAITTNGKQLLLTSLLGIILMYIWAIIGFYFLDDNFTLEVQNLDGTQNSENQCTTLLQCFIITVNKGLILGGGVGDFLTAQSFSESNTSRYSVRYIYDLLFFMVVKMAFLNIIFGIIIDTFADLRDKRNKMEEDMKNVCFICGLERDVFDQFADGFENHIERDHHLWNYLYYLYHLKITDETEYNGIESYVADKFRKNDSSWFPLLKAKSIVQEEDEDEGEKVNDELENIKNAIQDASLQIDRIQKQI